MAKFEHISEEAIRTPVAAASLQACEAQAIEIALCAGAMVETPHGYRAVEHLAAGDFVQTGEDAQPITAVARRRLEPADFADDLSLRPILIRSGAMGPGAPVRTLRLGADALIEVAARDDASDTRILACAGALVDGVSVLRDARDAPTEVYRLTVAEGASLCVNGLIVEASEPEAGAITAAA